MGWDLLVGLMGSTMEGKDIIRRKVEIRKQEPLPRNLILFLNDIKYYGFRADIIRFLEGKVGK